MKLKKLTESEQLVMKCIWMKEEHMALSEIVALANDRYGKGWKPQTVSTFLKYLVQKGYLAMYRQGRVFKYQPLIKEEEYTAQLLKEHIRFWNDNSIKSFASNLCREETMTKQELHELKEMLDDLEHL